VNERAPACGTRGSERRRAHLAQRRWARELQRGGHKPDQENGGGDGGEGRHCFDSAAQPIDGMPDHPDFHQVRGAAGDDENSETDEHPVECEVASLAHKIQQRERNGKIRERDQQIGSDMQREHIGLPQVAHAVRHESVGRGQSICASHIAVPLQPGEEHLGHELRRLQ